MTVKEKAYAKVNLFLDVTGRREDGYHDVVTVMHSVSLCDEITLATTSSNNIEIAIVSSDKSIAVDESNLIYKSALKYMSNFDISVRVDVDLVKRIPIGAGLGGGSSDAAATLRAMNRIYGFATDAQLLSMAAELGSDVPFCLVGGSAICTGRGEKLRPINREFCENIVIAIGKDRVSTPVAYALLDEKYGYFAEHNEGKRLIGSESITHYNIFESVIESREIDEIKKIMSENGAEYTLMSGSGPAVFGSFNSEENAERAKSALENLGLSAYRCRFI